MFNIFTIINTPITSVVEILIPQMMGFIPALFKSFILVLSPIEARATIIKNLDIDFSVFDIPTGINPKEFRAAIIINKNINTGIADFMLNSDFSSLTEFSLFEIIENITTVGIKASVLVSFTIVAKSPADSEQAYPAANTDDVSLMASPDQSPNAISVISNIPPINGKSIIKTISIKNTMLIEYAMSTSSASTMGDRAAMAVPPHIVIAADIRLDSFQFIPSFFLIIYPNP